MSLRTEYERDVAVGIRDHALRASLLTDEDLAPLPPAVQRYLRFVGVVGRPRVSNYRLRLGGEFRTGPDSPWMSIAASQLSFIEPAARLFYMKASMFGLPVAAYHRYVGPEATFRVKIASLVTVVDARGPEMNQSETVTMLNDMCLFAPATLLDPGIVWQEIGPLEARATFTNAGNTVSATLYFDEHGAVTDFVSDDRYMTVGKSFELTRWSTPVHSWREIDGLMLPESAEAIWLREGGDIPYARFETVGAEYNVVAGQ